MKSLLFFLSSIFLSHAAGEHAHISPPQPPAEVANLDIQSIQDLDRVEELARTGDDKAAVRVAEFYLFGPENYRDPQKALDYLTKSAQHYNMEAIEIMAGMYLQGNGVPHDIVRAERLYGVCAVHGYGPCQFNLGIIYKNDEGAFPKNSLKAYYWLQKAATNPHLDALVYDAAKYRNDVALDLSPQEREEIQDRVRTENEEDNIHLLDMDFS